MEHTTQNISVLYTVNHFEGIYSDMRILTSIEEYSEDFKDVQEYLESLLIEPSVQLIRNILKYAQGIT